MEKDNRINVVNKYLTPIGSVLILSVLIYSFLTKVYFESAVVLAAVAILNNIITARLNKKTEAVHIVRMTINVLINIWFVYLFIGLFESVWFLLLLTPVATAVYSSRLRTFIVSLIMGSVLIYIHAVRGSYLPEDWAMTIARVVIIIVLSQFICALLEKRDLIYERQK